MDSKSTRFPSPVERKSMWLQPSVAAGWSPGLLLVLDPACAICTCRWTMPPQWWCHEDARMLEGPTQEVHMLSHRLFVGLINQSGALRWQRCIVLAPPPAQTDAACASRYVGGACSCFCLFRVPSLASWTAESLWKLKQGHGQHCCACPFCVTGMEILGAPCGTCHSLLSLVTQKPWNSLLLFWDKHYFNVYSLFHLCQNQGLKTVPAIMTKFLRFPSF